MDIVHGYCAVKKLFLVSYVILATSQDGAHPRAFAPAMPPA